MSFNLGFGKDSTFIPYDPPDFYKYENFAYSGDYVLFGTN
jgi:hypothetical protein